MIKINLKTLKNRAEKEIEKAKDLKELNNIFNKYLGKKGVITQVLRSLKDLPEKKRKEEGKLANEIKQEIEKAVEIKKYKIQDTKYKIQNERLDITRPGKKIETGHLHPLTLVKREVQEIFESMGFSAVEGPEVETEWYNFDALNFPPEHPAREMQDTLWIKQKDRENLQSKERFLMRTHTSPVQIRYMEKNNPPLRIIVPGRVFRNEATDAGHEINFYHLEGLMVGEDISAANFKAIIQELFRRFFGKPVEIRLRPSYFPFVEPGFEVDLSCINCGGKGCSVCSQGGWVEILGAGMVHQNVFKAAGYKIGEWQGFAFGIGLDRLAMMKYKINDIRLFYGGDLRFLNQF